MWRAITKDFQEFTSTVVADAGDALETIDKKLDQPLVRGSAEHHHNNNDDDDGGGDTNETLVDPDTGIPISIVAAVTIDPTRIPWKPPTEATPEEMKERLVVSCEDVFRDPLPVTAEAEAEAETKDESLLKEKAIAAAEEITPETAEAEEATTPEAEEEAAAAEQILPTVPSGDEAEEVAAFLKEFDVGSKTEEISELLKSDPALQTTFSLLSDSVTYADFWTRYFYRIEDLDRLPRTYSVYYQNHLVEREAAEAAAEAEAAIPSAAMEGLSSFFGGVVSKLTKDDGEHNATTTDDDYDYDYDTSGMVDDSLDRTQDSGIEAEGVGAAARSALGFLSNVASGASGRPPFVMNTAISDDEDEEDEARGKEEADDEDSEEELGWDDEDEDDDYDGLDDDNGDAGGAMAFKEGDDRSETVDFKDAEKEGLLEELEQARAERDALQKTVQMQSDELKKAAASGSDVGVAAAPASGSGESETEALKLQLFEKDAELAALRSKLDDGEPVDDADTGTNAGEEAEEVTKLTQALAEKDRDFAALKHATQAQTKTLEAKLEEHSKQQRELEDVKATVVSQEEKLEALKKKREDESSEAEAKQAETEQTISGLKAQVDAFKGQLEAASSGKEATDDDDDGEGNTAALVVELQTSLATRDAEIATLQSKVARGDDQLTKLQQDFTSKSQELQEANTKASEVQTSVRALDTKLSEATALKDSLQAEIQTLQMQASKSRDEAEASLRNAKEQHSAVANLEGKLASALESLEASEADATKARNEIKTLRGEVETLQASLSAATAANADAQAAPPSPCSSSSGVRVDVPRDAAEAAIPDTPNAAVSLGLEPSENDGDGGGGDDENDGGWGDDW